MKLRYSFRFKLFMLYFLIITIPSIAIVFIMPQYYERVLINLSTVSTESTLAVLTQNIETYLDDLQRLTLTPYMSEEIMNALKLKAYSAKGHKTDPYEMYLSERALYNSLNRYLRLARSEIVGTVLVAGDGTVYARSTNLTSLVGGYDFTATTWYQDALTANGKTVFIGSHTQSYLEDGADRHVFSVARIILDLDTQEPIAFIKADADSAVLQNIIKATKFIVSSKIALLDDHNQVIYATDFLSGEVLDQIARKHQTIEIGKESYSVISAGLDMAGWSVAVLLSNDEIKAQVRFMYIFGILLALGGILLTIIVLASVSKWIIKPFKEMIGVMKRVQMGNLHSRFEVHGEDEVAQLGAALNRMIAHLNELIDREYRAKLNQRNAEYRSLQAQIQPHFLYNILNGFIGLNRTGEKEKLESAIISLSAMLRYILEHQDRTTIQKEFEFLRSYCELQQLRFKRRLQFEIRCEPELAGFSIPKLLLQPLVENSILHGIEPVNRPCLLQVHAGRIVDNGQTCVNIVIRDDGIGFDPRSVSADRVGLNNVKERLSLTYANARFQIESQAGHGTTNRIIIPMGG